MYSLRSPELCDPSYLTENGVNVHYTNYSVIVFRETIGRYFVNNMKGFLCFVDRASRYNRVKKNQLDAQLILSIFR